MKIGQTASGFKARMVQYRNPGKSQKTNMRINGYINANGSKNTFKVACFDMNDKCDNAIRQQESIIIGTILSKGYKLLNGSECECKECNDKKFACIGI